MFKQQPGFMSAQLHHGIGGSNTFFNYVVWESAKHFKQAFNRPEFRSSMADVLRLQSQGFVWNDSKSQLAM
jgi:heme-degrading monooxygenase HmoA